MLAVYRGTCTCTFSLRARLSRSDGGSRSNTSAVREPLLNALQRALNVPAWRPDRESKGSVGADGLSVLRCPFSDVPPLPRDMEGLNWLMVGNMAGECVYPLSEKRVFKAHPHSALQLFLAKYLLLS